MSTGKVNLVSPGSTHEFDFIVVGGKWHSTTVLLGLMGWRLTLSTGGTAGNVVAGRLAENPKVSILVIEAGRGYASHLL